MNKSFLSFKAKSYISLLIVFVLCTGLLTVPVSAQDKYDDSEVTEGDPFTIKEVLELKSGTEHVFVRGQLVYFATPHDNTVERPVLSFSSYNLTFDDAYAIYGNPVIQTVIEGKTYSLFIDGLAPLYSEIGDIVEFSGTFVIKDGYPMLTDITTLKIVESENKQAPLTVTIAEIKENGLNMLGRYVRINDVTLGSYKEFGLTKISDRTGEINLYMTSPYPAVVKAGDVVILYAVIGCSDSTVHLYAGTKEANGYNIFDNIYDRTPPSITEINYRPNITERDYHSFMIRVKDNRGVKNVFITYQIDNQSPVTRPMELFDADENIYTYSISNNDITEDVSQIAYGVTAVNISNVTNTMSSRVFVDHKPKIYGLTPEPYEYISFWSFSLSARCFNMGESPKCTLTLVKDGFPLFSGPITVDSHNYNKFGTCSASYTPPSTLKYPSGDYTATITFERIEDGFTASETWEFSLYGWDD